MSDTEAEIRQLVDSFVEQVVVLVRKAAVESAVKALHGELGAPRSSRFTSSTRAAAPRPGKRIRRSRKEIEQTLSKIVDYVHDNPGVGAEAIRKHMGLSSIATGDALRRLLESKAITKKGQRRATRYSAAKS